MPKKKEGGAKENENVPLAPSYVKQTLSTILEFMKTDDYTKHFKEASPIVGSKTKEVACLQVFVDNLDDHYRKTTKGYKTALICGTILMARLVEIEKNPNETKDAKLKAQAKYFGTDDSPRVPGEVSNMLDYMELDLGKIYKIPDAMYIADKIDDFDVINDNGELILMKNGRIYSTRELLYAFAIYAYEKLGAKNAAAIKGYLDRHLYYSPSVIDKCLFVNIGTGSVLEEDGDGQQDAPCENLNDEFKDLNLNLNLDL